jgi:hypothetical protein
MGVFSAGVPLGAGDFLYAMLIRRFIIADHF